MSFGKTNAGRDWAEVNGEWRRREREYTLYVWSGLGDRGKGRVWAWAIECAGRTCKQGVADLPGRRAAVKACWLAYQRLGEGR